MAQDRDVETLLNQQNWHDERRKLRRIMLDCGLEERVKWGKLCYGLGGANVVIIYGMKASCALGFFKGALLADDAGVLVAPGAQSQAMRRLHFTSLAEIEAAEDSIRRFIGQAIELETRGVKIAFDAKDNLEVPGELQDALDADPALAEAFAALTPGRRRGWVLQVSGAKRSDTRVERIRKAREKILAGKGPNER